MKKIFGFFLFSAFLEFAAAQSSNSAPDNWLLFLDDYWIESRAGVTPRLHQPEKHPGNPLIKGNNPWAINPYCFGTVLYDKEESIFKFWYMSYNYGASVPERTPVLYATSTDGITWTYPNLGLTEFEGTTDNNILFHNYGYHDLYSPSVIKDDKDPDPDRRYKMIWWDFPLGPKGYQDDGMCLAFSPDGIHWTKYPGNPVLQPAKQPNAISDVMMVIHDQRAGKYVAYTKGWNYPGPELFRQIMRTESSDFINWSKPEVVISHAHDKKDPQSYGMTVSQFGNHYIGLMCSYKKPGNETIDIQLVVSHDNRNWTRVADQGTFIPTGAPGSWDDGMLFTAPAINHGGKTLIYYSGWDNSHENKPRKSGIGLATLRMNGFVSLDAVGPGEITTHSIKNVGGILLVNVNAARGSLRAELLDDTGDPLPGYTADDCLLITCDSIAEEVRWRDHARLPGSQKELRIRFLIDNASFYGFYAGPEVVRIEK